MICAMSVAGRKFQLLLINAAWPAYEAALKAAGARYTAHQYAGTQHGFNNDTTPRFDATAAKLAWERTLAFFSQTLKS